MTRNILIISMILVGIMLGAVFSLLMYRCAVEAPASYLYDGMAKLPISKALEVMSPPDNYFEQLPLRRQTLISDTEAVIDYKFTLKEEGKWGLPCKQHPFNGGAYGGLAALAMTIWGFGWWGITYLVVKDK
jgi:hypothetical protein